MAKKKPYKRLTNAEKKENKEIRKEWREKGIIPPVKPKLNRKKFADEVRAELKEGFRFFEDIEYLASAIRWMMSDTKIRRIISSEQVGVLKLLKLAIELKKFEQDLKDNGQTEYDVMDLYDNVVDPIFKL